MRHMIRGQEYEIPTNADGTISSDVLRRAAGIAGERPLVLMRPDGSNQVVNPGTNVLVSPGQHFADMPVHRRGERG